MTKDEALKLALEVLNAAYVPADLDEQREKSITAIKQALAAPVQEPVAWIYSQGAAKVVSMNYVPGVRAIPLYTTPPAAPDLQAELDATNRQVEILSDALAESRREIAALAVPVHKPLHPEIKKMYEDYFDKCFRESSAEVPENFMDALMFDTAVRDVDAMIALARADERESCAKVCDRMAARCNDIRAAALESAAENIRARGQK
jgi:hypothetical protein